MKRYLPYFFVGFALLLLVRNLVPERWNSEFPVDRFAQLPVLEGGRYKPIDSLARTSLLLLRGKQYAVDVDGTRMPASTWLMHVMLHPEAASDIRVFRVDHEDVQALFGELDTKEKYFSYRQIIPHFRDIEEQAENVPSETALQDAGQRELLKLYSNLLLYQRLVYAYRVPLMQDTVEAEYARYVSTLQEAASLLSDTPDPDPHAPALVRMTAYARNFSTLSDTRAPKFVPTLAGSGPWLNLSESLLETMRSGSLPLVTVLFARLSDAYRAGDVKTFSSTLDAIEAHYESPELDHPVRTIQSEYYFNVFDPFGLSMALYLLVILAVLLAWLFLDERLLKTVFWIVLAAFLIHSGAMVARMLMQGRPPVTNLYSSAIFVGWGSVALGLIMERFFKNGIGAAVSSTIGFLTLIVASHLMAGGDTLEMMRAVLDSNFWLATHVITITLGYSATFLAGFLGIIYLILGIFTPRLDRNTDQALVRMVYASVCFGLLLSFVGTVLGGIWADQSWGRFWGWDPKENGALMIVLWTALILHAKRSGMVRQVGLMNLAIVGNIITSWSWFGTNMLGIGLHSYGFMSQGFFWLSLFCLSQFGFIMLGAWYPRKYWKSNPV